MHEIKKLVSAYDRVDFSKHKVALATVVNLKGSSYRRPGARMLVMDNGRWEGAISGGCLEGDALRKARAVMQEGQPRLVRYDTMDDDNNALGVALGCNGIIDVLIEPIDGNHHENPIEILRKAIKKNQAFVMATLFHCDESKTFQVGDRVLMEEATLTQSVRQNSALYHIIHADALDALHSKTSVTKKYAMQHGSIQVFLEAVTPHMQLLIYGGGYDAVPLCQLATFIGWEVVVSDNCIAHLTPKKFPQAKAVIPTEASNFLSKTSIHAKTAVVLMSHDYHRDLSILKEVLKSEAMYIGVLGPKKRGKKMLSALLDEDVKLSQEDAERLHNPCGLDIGAETPEEIAMSIISEIQAHLTNRDGQKLKKRKGHIHFRANPDASDSIPDTLNSVGACSIKPMIADS